MGKGVAKAGFRLMLKYFEIKKVFSLFIYKANRFHVVVRLLSNRSQKTSKCGNNIRRTLGAANFRFVNGRCHFRDTLTVNEFFSTKLKKKENLYVAT